MTAGDNDRAAPANPGQEHGRWMTILAIDVGGTHVKVLTSDGSVPRKARSGPTMTARRMVGAVKRLAQGWRYDVVTIGYPGAVMHGRPLHEPHNLGTGWVGFDFQRAFGKPVKVVNDAAMQALGGYKGGRMLFLGLGTGLGSALVVDGVVEPIELAHLPYKKGRTYEDYVGLRGLQRLGKKKWQRAVEDVAVRLLDALQADELVLGGGNAKLLTSLPRNVRLGDNANAFIGGFRLWDQPPPPPRPALLTKTPAPPPR
jgi:polyphosphate glucokinase